MGRKRKGRALEIYVGASRIGLYARASSGVLSFRYDSQWLASKYAFPVSLSMPLSDRTWSGDQVHSYFDGLLPDDQAIKDKIAAREQAESAGTFDLLSVIGRDCVGALRFVPEGLDPGDPARMTYRPVSDEEIARRMALLGTSPLGMSADEEGFRISIAGVQEKTAFLLADDQWQIPQGTTPTSHIFKPAIKQGPHGADFSDTPWNEWVCLAFCRALGLESARADVHHYDDKPVIVVERFDRQWQDGVLYRLPQEDICQALGVPPLRKYENDGGPGIVDVLALLNGAASPREDRMSFMKAQIAFWLLAAIDGHAKNFSILLTPGGYRRTPLYDVMSAAPYPALSDHKVKLAMAVGDRRHYRLKEIQPRHFYQTGQKAGLGKRDMDDLFADLLAKVDTALATVEEQAGLTGVPQATLEPILDGVKRRINIIEQ